MFKIRNPEQIEADKIAKEIEIKVSEYKKYLSETDYKMTVDYFATLDEATQNELITKREEAREFVRSNEITTTI